MIAGLSWTAADWAALGILAVLLAAVIRRVLYWSDQFRDYGERLARLEEQLKELERLRQQEPRGYGW